MKIKFFFTACIAIFILSGCVKSDLSESLSPDKKGKKGILPCPTALIVQDLPPGEMVYIYQIGGSGYTNTFTTTDYTPLETNASYRLYIPFGATVTYCSCGENYGTLTLPSNNVLNTSSDPTMYSTCDF